MKQVGHIIRIALIAMLLLSIPAAASAEIIDRIVARVNDDIVTLYDVRQAAIPFVLQQGMDPAILQSESQRGDLYKKVLDDLIDRNLLVQEAQKLELQISDDELNQWLAFTWQQQGMNEQQFAATIEQYGMRYEAYREMVRQNLLKIRMIKIKVGSQVSISQDEVDRVYKQRFGGDGGEEKFVTVSHILFRPENESPQAARAALERAAAAQKRLDGGEDFAEVAKTASEGPTASKGGFLGSFRRGELDPAFEKSAFKLEAGETSEIVKTKFGFHIIRVDKVDTRQSSDMEQRKDMIRGELQQKAVDQLLTQYLETLRTRSFVDVRY